MTDGGASNLADVLEAAAADLDEVEEGSPDTGVEWSTGGVVFAALDRDRAEFRLARPIVAAALRTPDTGPSARGPDWLAFAPAELDRHAIDRAGAWFASAWRRARAGD